MATTNTAALDNAMKIIYSDPLIRDIVSETELMDQFVVDSNVQSEKTTGGKYIEMAHYLRLPGAVGARAEDDYIPVSENPRFANSRIYLKKIIGTIEMTGDTMEKVVNDEGSFIDFMERSLPDTRERVVNDIDRQYAGFGAGIRARVVSVTGTAGAAVITLKDSLGVLGFEDAWLQFQEGERIVFSATAAGTALRNSGTAQSALIESIDETTSVLNVSMDAGLFAAIAGDDYIFGGDSAGSASQLNGVDREISGLLAGVDDGGIMPVYNNIDRSIPANRFWIGRQFDASVAPYNGLVQEVALMKADILMSTVAGKKPNLIIMNPQGPIGYWLDLKQDRSLNDPRSYTGGASMPLHVVLGDRTLPLKTVRKLPPQVAFMLNTSTWRRFSLNSWTWSDRTGSIWKQVTDGVGRRDAFWAYGTMYEQLACIMPRANLRMNGLTRQLTY